ncbi:MAG: hypothetical protein NC418_11115 [Muribaculaceae bacterium]|nr:hypothetical protein [Muribaculaceae bacterium]
MTAHSPLYMPSVFKRMRPKGSTAKPVFELSRKEWSIPLLYMLTLSLLGLSFYPALLFVLIFWVHAWKHDRYNLAIMLFLVFGNYSLLPEEIMGVKYADFGILSGVASMLLLRKDTTLKKVLAVYAFQIIAIVYISTFSPESFKVQLRLMRSFLSFVTVFIPLAVFANHTFDIQVFFRRMMTYALIMCAFYAIDAFILKGFVLIPNSYNYGIKSTFMHPVMNIFGFSPARKYPPGMYIFGLAIIPIIRYYRLKWWHVVIIVGGILATQTFSYMAGVLVCLVLFQSSRKRVLQYSVTAGIILLIAVGADYVLPYNKQKHESALRVRSTIDQFIDLADATDDEDLAEFMSGRVGQALPVIELISNRHTAMTGLGFIHPEKTTSVSMIIFNEYESDIEKADRVATEVEIVPVQIFIYVGWLGILVEIIFFGLLYWIVRKMKYRAYYVCSLVFTFVLGIGGFAGVDTYRGLAIVTMAYAVVLLADKHERLKSEESIMLAEK